MKNKKRKKRKIIDVTQIGERELKEADNYLTLLSPAKGNKKVAIPKNIQFTRKFDNTLDSLARRVDEFLCKYNKAKWLPRGHPLRDLTINQLSQICDALDDLRVMGYDDCAQDILLINKTKIKIQLLSDNQRTNILPYILDFLDNWEWNEETRKKISIQPKKE